MRRVLLVEDTAEVRRAIARILEAYGFEVLMAVSVAAATFVLTEAADQILFVLTDYDLPDGNGLTVARVARERVPSLPVVLMSGGSRLEGLPIPFPVLRKPFGVSDLGRALASAGLTLDHQNGMAKR